MCLYTSKYYMLKGQMRKPYFPPLLHSRLVDGETYKEVQDSHKGRRTGECAWIIHSVA